MSDQELPGPRPTFPLLLTCVERDALARYGYLDEDLAARLSAGATQGEYVVCHLTAPELDDLLDFIASAITLCEDAAMAQWLGDLSVRAGQALEAAEEARPDGEPPGRASYVTRDGASARGVSYPQMVRLIKQWEGENAAVRLNPNVSPTDVAGARFLRNARIFLDALQGAGSVKATVAGNLNRKFVASMMLALDLGRLDVASLLESGKPYNEQDIGDLHILRVNLGLAGLIKVRKGILTATRRGRDLSVDAHAGVLFERLFRTFFRRFSLCYLDPMPADHSFQYTVGFSLYVVSRLANDWTDEDRISEEVVHPAVAENLPPILADFGPLLLARRRLLEPLRDFGLIERRVVGKEGWRDLTEVRKTPLFDRFLSFSLGPTKRKARQFIFPAGRTGVH